MPMVTSCASLQHLHCYWTLSHLSLVRVSFLVISPIIIIVYIICHLKKTVTLQMKRPMLGLAREAGP